MTFLRFLLPTASLALAFACTTTEPPASTPEHEDAGLDTDAAAADADTAPLSFCDELKATLAAELELERASQRVNHAALGIYSRRCGTIAVVRSAERAKPVSTSETLFRISAVSATFIAATVVQLAQAKVLDLDAPIATWLPSLPRATEVTVKMLLNQTSGLPDYGQTSEFLAAARDRSRTPTVDERLGWIADVPFTHEPGAAFSYSSTNHLIVGKIIDLATGSSWASQVRLYALEKAGLTHTFLYGEEPVGGTIAPSLDTHELNLTGPDMAVVTTAEDLVNWARALYIDRTILDDAGFALMDTTIPIDRGVTYGLGMMRFEGVATGGFGTIRGHDGVVPGFQAAALAYEQKQWVTVGLWSKDDADLQKLMDVAEDVVAETDDAP